jgi:hypothetical protein
LGYPLPSVLCCRTLLKYLLQQRYRDVIEPLEYPLLLRCRDAISTRETILPLLSLLVSFVSTFLDGLWVQFQCTHGFVPGYLLGQTWRNTTDEEGVGDVYAS